MIQAELEFTLCYMNRALLYPPASQALGNMGHWGFFVPIIVSVSVCEGGSGDG